MSSRQAPDLSELILLAVLEEPQRHWQALPAISLAAGFGLLLPMWIVPGFHEWASWGKIPTWLAFSLIFWLGLRLFLERPVSRPNVLPQPLGTLRSWVQLGDVIEFTFDCGVWVLAKSRVNDRQWRDVLRWLLWHQRI